jgi:hypothetical protein
MSGKSPDLVCQNGQHASMFYQERRLLVAANTITFELVPKTHFVGNSMVSFCR